MPSPALPIREQQRAWARRKGIQTDKSDYTLTLRDNLYQSLSPCAEAEFRAGDGAELGKPRERGKMQALHSSSALACNVFDYWRGRDTSALAQALDVPAPICSLAFERKYPTGLHGKAPNLDVVLQPATGPALAIESKFLEPYAGESVKPAFKAKYFESEPGLWHDLGYPACQKLARSLYEGAQANTWLHSEQLLKHILGLSRTGGNGFSSTFGMRQQERSLRNTRKTSMGSHDARPKTGSPSGRCPTRNSFGAFTGE